MNSLLLEEPDLIDRTDGEERTLTLAEYLAGWGDDRSHAAFYNWTYAGNDPAYLAHLEGLLEQLLAQPYVQPGGAQEEERENLTACRDFVREKRRRLAAGEPVPAIVNEAEQFTAPNGRVWTYGAIRELLAQPHLTPFARRLNAAQYQLFARAVNQGIDSRLQACYAPDRGDQADPRTGDVTLSAESLPVLLRRLAELQEEDADDLVIALIEELLQPRPRGEAAAAGV